MRSVSVARFGAMKMRAARTSDGMGLPEVRNSRFVRVGWRIVEKNECTGILRD